jgi:hypothetical protein
MRLQGFAGLVLATVLLGWISSAMAQEAVIHHGFLFFAREKYSVDEQTFPINKDGNRFADLIKENKAALAKLDGYDTWHTTALVASGCSIAGLVFGAAYYAFYDDMSRMLGDSAGLISLATGGGLFLVASAFEFVAWGKISDAAHMYNGQLMDDGSASLQTNLPRLSLAVTPDKTWAGLTWAF